MTNLKQQVKFIPEQKALFFPTLKKKVDAYFAENNLSKHANGQMIIKSVCLISLYIIPFVLFLSNTFSWPASLGLWALMGIGLAGIGMSVMHDANHGSYSKSHLVNHWMGLSLNLLGGSVFNWKMQHNVLHHTYTNVIDLDDDIEDKLILRFSPHTKVKWYHKFQFIYAFFFYGILTLYWAVGKDFVQFRKYIKQGVNKDSKEKNRNTFLRILLSKFIYAFIFLIAPLVLLKLPVLPYLAGFLLMHFVAGIVLTVIFQLAHTVENTSHPLPDDAGIIENSWAIHQLNTTVNFSRHNKLISWYVGGLNYQVEHHLFPSICHVHYPAIAPIVKQTAEEFGVPYLENSSLLSAIQSHVRMLKAYGK